MEVQIKEEIEKLLQTKFIRPIQHPTSLSNIVPVKKSSGKIRCRVDFRYLNTAYPKEEFPLPNLDVLINATVNHEILSFMDGFMGYNQIQIHEEDAEKTIFRISIGIFCYVICHLVSRMLVQRSRGL